MQEIIPKDDFDDLQHTPFPSRCRADGKLRTLFDIVAFPFRAFNWLWQTVWTLVFKIVAVAFKMLGWAIWLVFWLPVFVLAILGNGWAMGFCFGAWHEENNQKNRTHKDR